MKGESSGPRTTLKILLSTCTVPLPFPNRSSAELEKRPGDEEGPGHEKTFSIDRSRGVFVGSAVGKNFSRFRRSPVATRSRLVNKSGDEVAE